MRASIATLCILLACGDAPPSADPPSAPVSESSPSTSGRSEAPTLAATAPGRPPSAASIEDFRTVLAELASRQGVEITWTGGPYRYDYDWGWGEAREAAEWEVELFTPVIAEELRLYPPGFLADIGFDEVVVGRDLWLEQQGVAQNISGYLFDGTLLLSASYTYKVNNRDKQRRYLHHLIWHRIDELRGTTWEDPEWVALNPEGFEYGAHTRGGIHDRTSETGLLTDDYPGFVNRYGTGNVPDDKADLFAYLMVLHHWVMERGREDPYLHDKVELMKARLARLHPAFDGGFWARVDAIRRDVRPYVTP